MALGPCHDAAIVDLDGTLKQITTFPPRGPEPERYEVDVVVRFDDVGDQVVVLQAYELVFIDDPQPGDKVVATTGGQRLTLRRQPAAS